MTYAISEQTEEGLGITYTSSTRTAEFSSVDISQPLMICISYNATGSSAPVGTFSNINITYQSTGGLGSDGEVVYFIVGQPTADTVLVDFPDSENPLYATIAAYQAVIQ